MACRTDGRGFIYRIGRSIYQTKEYKQQLSIAADGTGNVDLATNAPEGYSPVGFTSILTGVPKWSLVHFRIDESELSVDIHNYGSKANTAEVTIKVSFIRTR